MIGRAIDEIRALAKKALDDSQAEQRAARDATIREEAYMDKHLELMALADRIEAHACAPRQTLDNDFVTAILNVERPNGIVG